MGPGNEKLCVPVPVKLPGSELCDGIIGVIGCTVMGRLCAPTKAAAAATTTKDVSFIVLRQVVK